ncbi:MAG TPA: NTP transferase domain-containing protein [Solirubrobacteraceae bacterium]|jgi:molybdopterin-guanine dinucleotide biosynthesis protein A|nr:NTP transferase domain-containing protein [Solirubrobacteraceae bacterium]
MTGTVLVAVLAGGRGSRLGGAKPTVPLGELPLIAHPLAAAREAALDAVVVAKPQTPLPPLECDVIYERAAGYHPLHGLLAALAEAAARSPDCACVALACDMPFVSASLLSWLARAGRVGTGEGGQRNALVTRANGHLQPLLARYFPDHRAALDEALRRGQSLTAAAESLRPQIAGERQLRRFGDPARLCFSVDSDDDLQRAGRLL